MGACTSSKPIPKESQQNSQRQQKQQQIVLVQNQDINQIQSHNLQENSKIQNQEPEQISIKRDDYIQSDHCFDNLEINEEDIHRQQEEELIFENSDEPIQKPIDTLNFINTGQTLMQHRNQNDVKVLGKKRIFGEGKENLQC